MHARSFSFEWHGVCLLHSLDMGANRLVVASTAIIASLELCLDFHAMPMQNCIRTLLTETNTQTRKRARTQIRTYVQFILFLHVANQLHTTSIVVFDKMDETADVPPLQSSEQLTRIMRDNRIKTGN